MTTHHRAERWLGPDQRPGTPDAAARRRTTAAAVLGWVKFLVTLAIASALAPEEALGAWVPWVLAAVAGAGGFGVTLMLTDPTRGGGRRG